MLAIKLNNLTKQYKDRTVVNSLDFSIEKGEFFALLGENGAGKTTLIKMLCCLLAPTNGDALVLGNSIRTNAEAVKRKINISPQETAVAPNLTIRENLELIAGIYGSSRGEAKKLATKMLETFNLTERQKDKAKALSGGMQRRLSIAMGLITNPQILFLDEPTLGLDVRSRRELWATLSKLKGKMTIVLTTHYLEEAEALADRICILQKGTVKDLGTAEGLKSKTNTTSFEEAFLAICDQEVKYENA
ncbi:ATP-binding cassette domain-containing protein [Paenibacillus apiarius]|uniref:ATP-binding cassette domain-containing protein n=1 Tax=Paenibacillus apiarius TaxID=46240 RepID=UPI0019810E23|nr:ABC transporter ATP-binding protein [Paenibacillus apiarius]